MFLKTFVSTQRTTPYGDSTIFPVQSADKLLSGKEQKRLLKEIQGLLGHLSEDCYQQFYADLIQRFAEFVQLLPLMQGS